jgi:multiple sugar transport system permease protein
MKITNDYNRKRLWLGVWFTAPSVIVLLTVLAYPILASLVLSFLRVRFSGQGLSYEFYGLANYSDLLNKALFREALFRSVYFTVVEVAGVILLALLLSLMLNHPLGRGAFYRIVLLVPWALAPVANAVLWKWIYNANYGILNQMLLGLGLIPENIIWLGSQWLALNMILLADIWKAVPFIALLMLAGLQNIPSYLYKAARLDGANAWQQFVHVTLPGLKTTIVISIVLQSIWALKVFDLIYVLTKGSPADSTVLLNYLSWRETFSNLDVGFGAAIANVLFVMMFLLALIYIRVLRPRHTRSQEG